jgi:thiamine-phosphate pyrophosphorylase
MVAQMDVDVIVLREKDLDEHAYEVLARQVVEVLEDVAYSIPQFILHSYPQVAKNLQIHAIHMPLPLLRTYMGEKNEIWQREFQAWFTTLGASVHSVAEAKEAESFGATYLTAGHIFATDCKKGLPPRGLDFLEDVCKAVKIPVYAIGGIHADNAQTCVERGAAGVCMMSEYMK